MYYRSLLAWLLIPACCAFARSDDQPVHLTHEQAAHDTKTFLHLLEATHADPYSNLGGKVAFKQKAQELIRDLPGDGVSVPELADRLAGFIAPLRDGHTTVRGSRERWHDTSPGLAVQFAIASDGLLISGSDITELKDARGYKLISVNGYSLNQLMEKMSTQVAAENIYGSYVGLTIALKSYKLLHNLIPDLDQSQGVTYTIESPAGKRVDRKISWDGNHSADSGQWASKPVRWAALDRSDAPFYFRFLDSGRTAYFRVANMMPREGYEISQKYHVGNLKELLAQYYKAHKQDMPEDVDAALQGIPSLFEQGTLLLKEMKRRNTPSLVIDLRGNGGGSTPTIVPFFYQMFGDAYFGRKTDAEFLQVKSALYLEKYNSSVEQEREKDPNFELGEYVFSRETPGTAEEKRNKKLAEWRERGMSFVPALDALAGKPIYRPPKIAVLCDPGTFSAAFQAAFLLHEMRAVLVGVPPAQSPNAFMEGTEYVLPESRIRGYISNGMQMYLPKDPRANVLHPDYEVTAAVYTKYGFDEETSLRYAIDILDSGKLSN